MKRPTGQLLLMLIFLRGDTDNTSSDVVNAYPRRVPSAINSTCGSLTPARMPSANRISAKWSRKVANRRVRAQARQASARFITTRIDDAIASALSLTKDKVFGPDPSSSTSAVADSGATDDMFPDYDTFSSYKRLVGKFVTLGDDTRLPILGIGTAIYRLNGRVMKTRNALHVPDLRNPLFSVRLHRRRFGCGAYSSYKVGSFILFPEFSLEVDDSQDNLVSYESIGRSYTGPIHYSEPRDTVHSPTLDYIFGRTTTLPTLAPTDGPNIIEPDTVPPADSVPALLPVDDASLSSSASSTVDVEAHDSTIPHENENVIPPTVTISDDELRTNTRVALTPAHLASIHHDVHALPPVPPSATPAPCESRKTFESLRLHRIFGCRRFRNPRHLTDSAAQAELVHTGELRPTLGDFATIPNPARGKPIKKHRKYLDKVHMDIVYGDCPALGGFRYALLLVDVATRYCWIYGLTSMTSSHIVSALEQFRADAGGVPRRFHADFDKKLIGGQALKWILSNKSSIIAAPARRQSSNGLVERTWQTIVRMARAYVTENQVGREYWFYATRHAALMINQVPGRLGRKLTTPFELVHGCKPRAETWFQLFSVGYFRQDSDAQGARSNTEDQTLDGIAVGRDDKANTIVFYNPISKKYYRPPSFQLDESRLPVTSFPQHISYDGGLTCGLLRNKTDPVAEPFPPGSRVFIPSDGDGDPRRGTVQRIPLPYVALSSTDTATSDHPKYAVHLDDGTTVEATYEQLVLGTVSSDPPESKTVPTTIDSDGMPHFLRPDSKVTLDHNGAYHKGFIQRTPQGGYVFEVRRNVRSPKVDWSLPLPNFKQTWTTLVGDDILIPGHSAVSSFLRPSTTNANAPALNFVSAKNILGPCPPSLVKAIHPSNPDRQVWLDSYNEEKDGLQELDVYEKISKKRYLELRRTGVLPKAIPSMCVLVVKSDRNGKPHRAKSRIVVLGNHEDRYFSKSRRYAPVLKYSSLRLLTSKAVGDKRILQQGDCKNAFCNASLPDDEATCIRPPVGDPAFHNDEYWLLKKTLYGLRRSPHHWYNMVTKILKEMGLSPSPHDPCLYTGIIDLPSSGPQAQTAASPRQEISIGLYVDDFVYYSANDAEEKLFEQVLASKLKVDFMGDVDYFLGTAFTWRRGDDGHLAVHFNQTAFTEFSAHRFGLDKVNRTPNMTPYRSGLPIDSISPPSSNDPDQKRRTKVYQSIVGSINWLATCTRPDVAPALTFLASYNMAPAHQHYVAALHVMKYLASTADYGITYSSAASHSLQAFNHFPHHHDQEAYSDATPPAPSECHQLSAFCDANWGSQMGNVVEDGTPVELFKLRSLSGFLICRTGGPIAWRSIRQKHTSLSSCEAEIVATNECITELMSIKHRARDLGMADADDRTTVYNDNQAAVNWAASITTKGIKHLNLRENMVRECHLDGSVTFTHIPGVINPSDIFTKEMRDCAHFRRLRDSMMVSMAAFLKYKTTVPSEIVSAERILPYYSLSSAQDVCATHTSCAQRAQDTSRAASPRSVTFAL